jgi:aldose 1-epimerase
VETHVLRNRAGTTVRFIPLGGIITAIEVPDRQGRRANVVLGLPDPEAYRTQSIYLGALIGRYANRIANARFSLDGVTYALAATDGPSSVHGGRRGFDRAEWQVTMESERSAVLRHLSPDGEEGYPGQLAATVRYSLADDDAFRIDYEAVTDRPTIVNLTNHSYFNLAGEGSGDILGHRLTLHAGRYTPADAILIPTGEIAPVAGTPYDFRRPMPLGARIREPHPQMIAGRGYDLNYVVDGGGGPEPVPAARLHDPASGRVMELLTSAPGLQLYTGNLLDGTIVGTSGRLYRQSDGLCLEPHLFPDSPNKPGFPSPVLRPGDTWRSATIYRFGVEAG